MVSSFLNDIFEIEEDQQSSNFNRPPLDQEIED